MTESNKLSRREWFRLRPLRTESDDAGNLDGHSANPAGHSANHDGDAGNREGRSANPGGHSMGGSPGLRPVGQPVNHDGMDLSELPPMREACLSEEHVRQLFSDIAALASDIRLMQKSPRAQRASALRATTAEQMHMAQDALLSGAIARVQIRYHWQKANWIDTLERREDGVRLIRIAHAPATTP